MAKKTVDIAAMLGKQFADVPELDTSGREQIRYIDIDLIDDDPNNFYALDCLDELAANIELCGLQQPIRVRAGESGHYTIVSGHRRRAALRKLVEDGQSKYREVPCIEERDNVSPAMQKMRLILANMDTRKMSSADIAQQQIELEKIALELESEGYEIKGRKRDWFSEILGVSKSKLARINVIRKKLIPLWAKQYDKNKISEDMAYELAKLPEDHQLKLQMLQDGKYGCYASTIKEYAPALASLDAIKCPNGEQCCTNADNMWSRMLKRDYCTKHCDGRYGRKAQCCKGCPELSKCKYACPAFADEIAKEKAEAKAERQEEKAAKEAAEKAHIASVAASWARVGAARKAAKLKMNDFIRGIYEPNKPESASYSDWREKEWANREKGEGITLSDRCFGADILNNDELIRAADILGCSLDYLLGRVDDPQPFTGEWKSALEERPDEGRFLFVCDGCGCVQPSVFWQGDYMDATPQSVANNRLKNVELWMYQPALPDGMKHMGQETLNQIMKDRGMDV
ncbi:ParB/RepB/Spo0J family partition protein [Oscillibacter ruminantium]|uniref:ParB/RepB/Spo0J family partition protein n=1 Tax=Oscillibacter ruminantium TaxID=1263547 RepID=UPI0002E696E9|nr:ParB/RepB/Spo0J family partition protein [Oscillibacter ruminantium]